MAYSNLAMMLCIQKIEKCGNALYKRPKENEKNPKKDLTKNDFDDIMEVENEKLRRQVVAALQN